MENSGRLVETKPADVAKPCEQQLHYVVPQGGLFALGDNRYNSIDARYYGYIPRHNLRGRPLFIYFSFDLDDWRLRWSRLGKVLWRS